MGECDLAYLQESAMCEYAFLFCIAVAASAIGSFIGCSASIWWHER